MTENKSPVVLDETLHNLTTHNRKNTPCIKYRTLPHPEITEEIKNKMKEATKTITLLRNNILLQTRELLWFSDKRLKPSG